MVIKLAEEGKVMKCRQINASQVHLQNNCCPKVEALRQDLSLAQAEFLLSQRIGEAILPTSWHMVPLYEEMQHKKLRMLKASN